MRLSLPEQESMMREFADPVDFIGKYVDVYEKQRGVPVKVYLEDISYYERFEAVFLDMVLRQVLSPGPGDLNVPEAEALLAGFCSRQFFDERFYLESTLVLIKGIAVLIDRVDQEVQRGDFGNLRYLYHYTTDPIDLTRVLAGPYAQYVEDPCVLAGKMSELRRTVEFVNGQVEGAGRSFLADDRRLRDRMNLSEGILGPQRVERYEARDVYRSIFDLLMVRAGGMCVEEGYMYIMGFCSEYVVCDVGSESDIQGLKEYAGALLGGGEG